PRRSGALLPRATGADRRRPRCGSRAPAARGRARGQRVRLSPLVRQSHDPAGDANGESAGGRGRETAARARRGPRRPEHRRARRTAGLLLDGAGHDGRQHRQGARAGGGDRADRRHARSRRVRASRHAGEGFDGSRARDERRDRARAGFAVRLLRARELVREPEAVAEGVRDARSLRGTAPRRPVRALRHRPRGGRVGPGARAWRARAQELPRKAAERCRETGDLDGVPEAWTGAGTRGEIRRGPRRLPAGARVEPAERRGAEGAPVSGRSGERSIVATARWAAVLNVLSGVPDGFSVTVVRKLFVRGDAAATAANLLASERLFRLGFRADLGGLMLFIASGVLLYEVFKPASRRLALLFLILFEGLPLIQSLNSAHDLAALLLVKGGPGVSGLAPAQADAMAYVFLRLHSLNFN